MTGSTRPDGAGTPAADDHAVLPVPQGTDADEAAAEATAAAEVEQQAAESADDRALAHAGLGAEGAAGPRQARGSLAHRLYNGETGLDVVGRRRFWFTVTAVIVLLCVLFMGVRQFNFGIDFAGGNSLRVAGTSSDIAAVRSAAEDAGAQVASVQVVGGNEVLLRTSALTNSEEDAVVDAVAGAVGATPGDVSVEAVSADWGRDITDQALLALAVFLVAVVLFLAIRFQPKMAIAAMAALLHDIIVTAGIYALIGFEVSPSTVVGLLTILGFSLYDTVVVFDKVDENVKDLDRGARMTWGEAANLAVNQTLMRSINTSVIALLPVAGLLFVGAGLLGVGTLKDLALVLFVGMAVGTYSSIFLATPVLAELKEREPAQVALRKRVLARRSSEARQAAARSGVAAGPVATARRARRGPASATADGAVRASSGGATALAEAERGTELPGPIEADVPIESPSSVTRSAPTSAPRPGARPQRPGQRGPGTKKRR
ncbi:protein translocase subunit SecF [Modestobacter sp. I12A-02628]|uniref:Protein-export membrane protein SecF n=1 Tax=Goekera deserti TaxID=2497753 RepID=A0A7K3WA51_9ACTN|nr:protein translocase subunit SecF [Goekera deserti]MPQ99185.1 protein translocase subunit SecF [Goekera deserti]NDI47520.1 protein translocase subunit SecF [Goekera deserti]NEL53331.1 protein translocase subunit SecF [Goekera deserti]